MGHSLPISGKTPQQEPTTESLPRLRVRSGFGVAACCRALRIVAYIVEIKGLKIL
jgi:hypothetical protein